MSTSTIDAAGLEGGVVTLTSERLDDLVPRMTGRFLRAGDEGWDATYGANLDRLVEVRRTYDPDNLFRVNRNVAPAGRRPVRQDTG